MWGLVATGAALQLENWATELVRLPKTDGDTCWVGVTSHPRLDTKTSNTGIQGAGLLYAGNWELDTSIWACPGSYLYGHFSANNKLSLAKTFKIMEVVNVKRSMFVGHGYVQYLGARWKGYNGPLYHTYIVPEGAASKDAVAFAHVGSLRWMPEGSKNELINLHVVDEDPSDVYVDRPLSGKGHSSNGSSKKTSLVTMILGTAGVNIIEAYCISNLMKILGSRSFWQWAPLAIKSDLPIFPFGCTPDQNFGTVIW